MRFREAIDEQRFEEAKRDPPVDGSASRKGNEQRIGAPPGSFHTLRRPFDA
jgi:hypothetical protein